MSKMGTYLEYERKKCSGNDTGISLNKMVTEFEQKFLCEHDEQKQQNQEKGGEIQMYIEIN